MISAQLNYNILYKEHMAYLRGRYNIQGFTDNRVNLHVWVKLERGDTSTNHAKRKSSKNTWKPWQISPGFAGFATSPFACMPFVLSQKSPHLFGFPTWSSHNAHQLIIDTFHSMKGDVIRVALISPKWRLVRFALANRLGRHGLHGDHSRSWHGDIYSPLVGGQRALQLPDLHHQDEQQRHEHNHQCLVDPANPSPGRLQVCHHWTHG